MLLYDLTSTYFEGEMERNPKSAAWLQPRRTSGLRATALVATPDGFPLAYEVMNGNTADCTTLRDFLKKIETTYGKARRAWKQRAINTSILANGHRADAHVFIAFLAYCLQVTLKNRLPIHAPDLTPLSVFEKLSTIQRVEVWIPMLDGRWLVLPRHTQPEPDVQALLEQIRITLPPQPPPRITSSQLPAVGMNQPAFPEEPLRSRERSAV